MSLTKVSYSIINGSPVNVLDYGAVGDGVADDTAALQAAIDYVGSIHGTLIIPQGLYKTTATLYIDNENVIIKGLGNPSRGAGVSRGLPGDVTQGSVIQYTGTTTAIQVSKSRSADPKTNPSNPGFISGIQIHNLRIEVPPNCQKALFVFQAASSYFFNITMWGAQSTGGVPNGGALLYVQAGIDNIYELINTNGIGNYTTAVPDYTYYANYGAFLTLGWGNDLATTTIFRRCYFNYSNIGVNLSYIYQFEDCIFEACRIGIQCLNDITSYFERCWWEANTDRDINFNNSIVSIKNSRINSFARQQFFTTGGGVLRLQFDNVIFQTSNAAPFMFGVDPTGNNIFSPTTSEEIILFNNCSFPSNTQMGFIYNSNSVNKIQIQNMPENVFRFKAAAVGASSTVTLTPDSGTGGYTMGRKGHIVGMTIYGSAAISAGFFNVAIKKNGTNIADISSPTLPSVTVLPFKRGFTPFFVKIAQDDILTAVISTNAAWSPSNDICLELVYATGPSGEV